MFPGLPLADEPLTARDTPEGELNCVGVLSLVLFLFSQVEGLGENHIISGTEHSARGFASFVQWVVVYAVVDE